MILHPLSDRVVAKESVGPDVKSVKAGDKIIFKEYSTTDVKFESQEYLIVREEDILAIIK